MKQLTWRRPGLVPGAACVAVCLLACEEQPGPTADAFADAAIDAIDDLSRLDADEDAEAPALLPGAAADLVVHAPHATGAGFLNADLAVNGVRGGGETSGSLDVFSLRLEAGVNDTLVLGWSDRRVVDTPGVDLVVFENAFRTSGDKVFMDLAVVEVSADGDSWVAFPHDYVAEDETKYKADPALWVGFAGRTPVLLHAEDNPVDPFDAEAAGGDGFDLADLPGEAGEVIRAEGVRFVRIASAAARVNPDTGAKFPRDGASDGPDIDGVWARALVADPAP